jgi:hypothetical protein
VTMNAVAIRDIRQLGPVHSNKCCQSPKPKQTWSAFC